jgi:hypothetical protein
VLRIEFKNLLFFLNPCYTLKAIKIITNFRDLIQYKKKLAQIGIKFLAKAKLLIQNILGIDS